MRLLIVEDDALLGEALAIGLRQLGHAVDAFADGALAGADDSLIKPIAIDEPARLLLRGPRSGAGRSEGSMLSEAD
jgi:DNA-binding response OmpR family regulator